MQKRTVLFFIACLFLVSCGLKGPPLPPEAVAPERIADLKLKKVDGGVLLKWSMPTANTDATPLTDLAGFKVLRKDVPDKDVDCPPCTRDFEEIADFTLTVPGKAQVMGDSILFTDTSLSPSITYTYVVISYNAVGNFSKTSNSIDVYFERVK